MASGKKKENETKYKITKTVNITTPYIQVILTSDDEEDSIENLVEEANKALKQHKNCYLVDNVNNDVT